VTYDFDLVAIGSGPAGQRAAVQAAKLGKRAAIVEKRRCVGGVCLDTGTIPSKTLREAVVTYARIAGKGDRLPWARLDARPSCSQLLAGVDHVVAREVEVIEDQLRRNEVSVLAGEASFADSHTLVIRTGTGTRRVTAANVVIAVGTEPATTPGVKPDGEVILTTDDIVRLPRLPRTLAVVGAGVIGIEYASISPRWVSE
jgi:NAD(P) transhydrogenase